MSIIISPATSLPSSAPATMVPSTTETATAAADLATAGMAIAAERVATIVFRDAIYIIRCRWVAANLRMTGGQSGRLQEWRRKGQMRHFLQYKGLVDGGGKTMDMDVLDRDLDKNNDDGQKIFRFLVFIQNLMLLLQLTRL